VPAAGHINTSRPVPAEIGGMFRDLRRALNISLPELASRLGTRIDVLNALEKGDLSRLPPWPETARIVAEFTAMGKIDPRPVLGVLSQQMAGSATLGKARVPPLQKLSSAYRTAMVPAAAAMKLFGSRAATASASVRMGGFRGLVRKAVWLSIAAGIAGAAFAAKDQHFGARLATLSPPLGQIVRGAQDYVVLRSAPVRDGLRWIEVDDPRTRRGDRLDGGRL
jgi:transcriptional regulator with XRE-family HTH domain